MAPKVSVYQLVEVQPRLLKGLKKLRVPKLSKAEEGFLRGAVSTNRARESRAIHTKIQLTKNTAYPTTSAAIPGCVICLRR
jgi:hypothetical protein